MPTGVYKHKSSWNKGKKLSKKTREKMSESRKGSKNPAWKGGVSRKFRKGYWSKEYKEWRLKVFNRDNFACVNCDQIGGDLIAHHIKTQFKYLKLRYDVNNGITLCEECHTMLHKLRKAKLL